MKNTMEEKMKRVMNRLRENGFGVKYFENREAAGAYLMNDILPDETVGIGGSNSIQEMDLFERLKIRGNRVYYHRFPEEGMDRRSAMMAAMGTDVYLAGVNGLTEDGRIINIDGTGNRLAGMLFGHKRLYLVAGVNKISRNYEEAMIRIKNVACPLNTRNFGYEAPCAKTDKCGNCEAARRICNATLILERQAGGIPTTVVLIGEEMGF